MGRTSVAPAGSVPFLKSSDIDGTMDQCGGKEIGGSDEQRTLDAKSFFEDKILGT